MILKDKHTGRVITTDKNNPLKEVLKMGNPTYSETSAGERKDDEKEKSADEEKEAE